MSKELYLEALDWLRGRVQREGETPEELHAMARRIASFEDHETADDFIRFYAESLTQTDPDKWPDLEWILETKGGGILMNILGPLSQWVELMRYRGQFGQRIADEIVTLAADSATYAAERAAAVGGAGDEPDAVPAEVARFLAAESAEYAAEAPPPLVIDAWGWVADGSDDDDDDGDYPEGFWADDDEDDEDDWEEDERLAMFEEGDDDDDDGDLWEDDPDEANEYVGDDEEDDA